MVGLNFGKMIVRDLLRAPERGVQIVAVCDQSTDLADRIAAEAGVSAAYSLAELLERENIEAVGLFTGPHGRAGLIRQIIRAGRDVVTTKPFEMDVAAAESVLAEAAILGRQVHLNSPGPFVPADVALITELVARHDLGRPLALRAETWAGYQEKADGSWYDDPSRCPAAPLLRLGIYFLNDFCPLMGPPASVHVMTTRVRTGRPTPDHAQVGIRFANGALGQVFASLCVDDARPYRDELVIIHERGTVRRWVERPVAHVHDEAYAVVECTTRDGGAPVRHETSRGAYAGHYQWLNFARSVRGLTPLAAPALTTPAYGVRLLEAIGRSERSGREEPVLPG